MCTRCAHVILRYQDEATETHAYPNGSTCSYVDNLFFEPRKTRTHARRLLRVCLLGRACAGDPHAHVNRHVSSHASPHVGDKRRSAQARTVFTSDVVASRRTAGGAALPGRRTASTGLKDPRSHRLGDARRHRSTVVSPSTRVTSTRRLASLPEITLPKIHNSPRPQNARRASCCTFAPPPPGEPE